MQSASRKNLHQFILLSALMLLIFCLLAGGCSSNIPLPGEDAEAVPQATPEPTPTPVSKWEGAIEISEIMYRNKGCFTDGSGNFPDYIELHNISSQEIDMSGWSVSDGPGDGWVIPSGTLAPDAYMLIYCSDDELPMHSGFSLSDGENVSVTDPEGFLIAYAECIGSEGNSSLILSSEDGYSSTLWISPGYENSTAGYEAYCSSLHTDSPIIINEVMVSSSNYVMGGHDWVELKNVSSQSVVMEGFYLSDDEDELTKWSIPSFTMPPGAFQLIFCSGDVNLSKGSHIHSSFSLDAEDECLILSDGSGNILDFVHLHSIPSQRSMGRVSGREGFCYLDSPTPDYDNTGGMRRVAQSPVLIGTDGVFNDVTAVEAELSAPGSIVYTVDGSYPEADDAAYAGPVSIDKTCILRAVAFEDDALPSPASTYSYILNEYHTLPVLSLAVDSPYRFSQIYSMGIKHENIPANLALYEDPAAFNHRCDMRMKGFTSLSLPKKSMGVSFKGQHGGMLEADVFGNGITEYSALAIRAGQDYTFSIFRNELFQQLCQEGSDSLLTQNSKYCILYINGEYRGIYCIKDDLNRQFYASQAGVSKESVELIKFPAPMGSSYFDEVLKFCWENDLSVEENYRHIESLIDVDSLIDWFIFEGYTANTDIQGNLKVYRSPEADGRWKYTFYDLDWGFYYPTGDYRYIIEDSANTGYYMPSTMNALLCNAEFRDKVLTRFAELNKTVLSNENVLSKIDELQALLEPEAARDRERWGLNMDSWYSRVDELRHFIIDNDWDQHNLEQICLYLHVTEEERAAYFG